MVAKLLTCERVVAMTQAGVGTNMGSHSPIRRCKGKTSMTTTDLQSHFMVAMDDMDNNEPRAMFSC